MGKRLWGRVRRPAVWLGLILTGWIILNSLHTEENARKSEEMTLPDKEWVRVSGTVEWIRADVEGAEVLLKGYEFLPVEESCSDRQEEWHGPEQNKQEAAEREMVRPRREKDKLLVLLETVPAEAFRPEPGNRVVAQGRVDAFRTAANPGQFDEEAYYSAMGYAARIRADSLVITDGRVSWWRKVLSGLRDTLWACYSELLPKEEAGVLSAMLLGEKQDLEPEIKTLYQENGISHLLAISGLHVALLCTAVAALLKKLHVPHVFAGVLTIFFLFSYGILTGFSVSTERAVVMMTLSVLAGMVGRTYDMASALAVSGIFILFQHPSQLFQPGFQLSFGAAAGIGLVYPVFRNLLGQTAGPGKEKGQEPGAVPVGAEKGGVSGIHSRMIGYGGKLAVWAGNGIAVSLSVTMMTLPVMLWHFYEVSLIGILWNLAVIPFLSLLVPAGLAGGFLGLLHRKAGAFLLGSCHMILAGYRLLCGVGERLMFHKIVPGRPEFWQIVFYYILLAAACRLAAGRRRKTGYGAGKGTSVFILAAAIVVLSVRERCLTVTMLDVGQGDGNVILSEEGTVFVIDCGSSSAGKVGTYRLIPFLKYKGIPRVDYLFLTHMDEDHISGAVELMESDEVEIGRIVLSDAYRENEALQKENYERVLRLAKEKKTELLFMGRGDRIEEDGLQLRCLYPPRNVFCSEDNAASLVLSLEYGEFTALFTGDLGKEGEERLLQEERKAPLMPETGRYRVLKVGHHGSKNSSGEEFLDWCGPEYALISCGLRNRYGHPHGEVLKRLAACGSSIYETDQTGAVEIRYKNGRMSLSTWKK